MAGLSNGFWIYKTLIDPLTSGLRKEIVKHIEPGSSVLDIACGPGTLLLELSQKIKEGTGIDVDDEKIAQANTYIRKKDIKNIGFKVVDARELTNTFENRFDYVILSLAVHQFPEPLRSEILSQALTSGKQLIIADYSVPVPVNFSGFLSKLIERIAGKEHNNAYKSFVSKNGIDGLQEKYELKRMSESRAGDGVFTICRIKSNSNNE